MDILSYAGAQLLPKILKQDLDVMTVVSPVDTNLPFLVWFLHGTAAQEISFGEVRAFWDTTFRTLRSGDAVFVVHCNLF
jgi:hypothetical protein